MDIKPEHETFGRDVELKEIKGIDKVGQPGILDKHYFFNPGELEQALYDLVGYSGGDILVYFRNIGGGISYKNKNNKGKWWDMIKKFHSCLGEDFPAGVKMEYWYNPDRKSFSLPEFRKDKPPYESFIKLFDNAIQGFSCFVNESQEGISFSSTRTNYETMQPGVALIHDEKTLWVGSRDVFLKSAQILYRTFREFHRTAWEYKVGIGGDKFEHAEIRIISPTGKAVVGSLVEDSSVTLFINNSSLERIVKEHSERMRFQPVLPSVHLLHRA